MLKWIINILLFYALYKLFKGVTSKTTQTVEEPQGPTLGEELVEDPQCGVYVSRQHAIKGPDGTMFCSRECLEAYKNPKNTDTGEDGEPGKESNASKESKAGKTGNSGEEG